MERADDCIFYTHISSYKLHTYILFVSIAAVAEEKKRQREGLKKQRDQYISRSEKMKRELKELKQQKSDLAAGHGKRSPSPKTNGFIKENEKLQVSRISRRPKANGLSHQLVCVSLCTQSFYFCGIIQGLSVVLDFKQNIRQSTTCFSFFFSGFLRKFVRKMIKNYCYLESKMPNRVSISNLYFLHSTFVALDELDEAGNWRGD